MNLSFEFEIKDRANFKKHKVSFAEGKTIFNDPLLFTRLRTLKKKPSMTERGIKRKTSSNASALTSKQPAA